MPTHRPVGYMICTFLFYAFGAFSALMIPFCYAPNQLAQLFGDGILDIPLVRFGAADRSAASMMCITLALHAIANYFLLRERRWRQRDDIQRCADPAQMESLGKHLPDTDPLKRFCQELHTAWSQKRSPGDEHLELLYRALEREDDALRGAITPLVVLGLLGTLLGVFVGFLLTFGSVEQIQLHYALQQAVVVVAAACLSSVWGIGLGQLVVAPLVDQLEELSGVVFDEAIAIHGALQL